MNTNVFWLRAKSADFLIKIIFSQEIMDFYKNQHDFHENYENHKNHQRKTINIPNGILMVLSPGGAPGAFLAKKQLFNGNHLNLIKFSDFRSFS